MTLIRHVLACLLCVALIATGGLMSSVRAGAGPGGFMVLCSGSGLQTIPLNSDGLPSEGGHICPDCLVRLDDAVLQGPPQRGGRYARWTSVAKTPVPVIQVSFPGTQRPPPRAPPA